MREFGFSDYKRQVPYMKRLDIKLVMDIIISITFRGLVRQCGVVI